MGSSKTKTSTTQQNLLPAYMREGSERAVGMAMDRTNQQYQAYGGQRIADISENERMGIDMARSNVGANREDYQSARDALGSIGSFTDSGVAEQYMNPYMEQVVQPGLRRKNEAFESERARRKQGRGMKNAFGGRGDMMDNQFSSNFERDQDEFMGQAYGAAYESATNLHGREQDRSIAQAGAYTNLAQTQGQANRNQLRDLMATGITERTRDQADLDFQYLEHLEERDWDVNNLQVLVDTLQRVPSESTIQTDSTTTTTPSPMQSIAAVGSIAAGAIMTGGASLAAGGTFWGGVGTALMGGTISAPSGGGGGGGGISGGM